MDEPGYISDDYQPDRDSASRDQRRPFPSTVRAAGVIWLGFGLVALTGLVLLVTLGRASPMLEVGCCATLYGLAFLECGVRTLAGTATRLTRYCVESCLIGLTQLVGAVVIGAAGEVIRRNPGGLLRGLDQSLFLFAVVVALLGLLLLLAGVLGFVGETGYREWRQNDPQADTSESQMFEKWNRSRTRQNRCGHHGDDKRHHVDP